MFFAKKTKESRPFITAIIAAAGSSERMGGQNKLLIDTGGVPLIGRTLLAFERCSAIDEVIIAARADMIVEYSNIAVKFGCAKVSAVVAGGQTRLESVYKAALQADARAMFLAVHDGARPFISPSDIEKLCREAQKHNAAIAATVISDTVKRAPGGIVEQTIDRQNLFAVQTPQVADKVLLIAALGKAIEQNLDITDEGMALENIGVKPKLVTCSKRNIKITTAEDLSIMPFMDD